MADDMLKNMYYQSAYKSLASGFADIASGAIDYSTLRSESMFTSASASQVELQAMERANMLREQFIGAIGNAQYSAVTRGISSKSGSVVQDIERSAEAMGKDIQREEKNAAMQASTLRAQAKLQKMQAKSSLFSGIFGGLSSFAGAMGSYQYGKSL